MRTTIKATDKKDVIRFNCKKIRHNKFEYAANQRLADANAIEEANDSLYCDDFDSTFKEVYVECKKLSDVVLNTKKWFFKGKKNSVLKKEGVFYAIFPVR